MFLRGAGGGENHLARTASGAIYIASHGDLISMVQYLIVYICQISHLVIGRCRRGSIKVCHDLSDGWHHLMAEIYMLPTRSESESGRT